MGLLSVFPVCYGVEPSHVRHQRGNFGKAFAKHKKEKKEKVKRWTNALTQAANLSGLHVTDG